MVDESGAAGSAEATAGMLGAEEDEPRASCGDAVRELLIERPLYASIEGDDDFCEEVDDIIRGDTGLEFDLYCSACGQVTPWTIKPLKVLNTGGGAGMRYGLSQPELPNVRSVRAVCLRKQHYYVYVLYRDGSITQKIGQKPSMADIAHGELRGLTGLDRIDRKELGRALGLFAHDTPLGAFVYLRRVFERIVQRAHDQYVKTTGSAVEGWQGMKMGQRVRALGDALPGEIASNAGVFSLLSKGIHQLGDDDAEALFPLIKAVIFQMLGDEQRHRQARLDREATDRALQGAIARHAAGTEIETAGG